MSLMYVRAVLAALVQGGRAYVNRNRWSTARHGTWERGISRGVIESDGSWTHG